jgi:hypothetical protein
MTEESELRRFLQIAHDSSAEAMDELEQPLHFLSKIDDLFVDFSKHLGKLRSPTASILLLNSHACVRAAARLAIGGQLLPVFIPLRGSIESALYANAMMLKPSLQDIWLKRDRSQTARRRCRDVFSIAKMFRYLYDAHERKFADGVREMYNTTIDFGAHPNNRLLLGSTLIEELETGQHQLTFTYIHGARSFELRQSIVACAETALAVFFIALIAFEQHPDLELLNDRALELQERTPTLVKLLGLGHPDEGLPK